MQSNDSITRSRTKRFVRAGAALIFMLTAAASPTWAAKPPKPPPPPPPAATYTYLNLGSLGGGYGHVFAVNAAGQVVGYSLTAAGDQHAFLVTPQDTNGDGRPDLWNPTGTTLGFNPQMTDLGLPAGTVGTAESFAMDVNDLGQIIGYCFGVDHAPLGAWLIDPADADGDGQPEWFANDGHGANALMVPLRLPAGYADWIAINNLGQIAAACSSGGVLLNPLDTNGDGQPDTWYEDADNDGANDLLVELGQARTGSGALANLEPRDINDAGQIAGVITAVPLERSAAFRLTPTATPAGLVWCEDLNGDGANDLIERLPLPAVNVESRAAAINQAGTVAGSYRNTRGFVRAAFWKADAQGTLRFTDLGVPKNEEHTGAHGINDRDQVVGFAHTYGAKAVYLKASGWIWENGVMTDVRALMDQATDLNGLKMETMGINPTGLMVGWTSTSETTMPRWPWIAVPVP
jgi:probable HAF family extracellular repeat protein